MSFDVKMPRMSQTTDEVRLVQWLVREGDRVNKGDPLCQVETDKTTMDVEAFQGGTVLRLFVPQDSTVIAGDVIASLGEPGEKIPEGVALAPSGEAPVGPGPAARGTAGAHSGEALLDVREEREKKAIAAGKVRPDARAGARRHFSRQVLSADGKTLRATPLVQNIAKKKGIPLDRVKGSGPGGLITKKDLEAYREQGLPAEGPQALSAHQLAVARSLVRSAQEIPHFYLKCRCFADSFLLWRERNRRSDGQKVSMDAIFIYAASRALQEYPRINGSFKENRLVVHSGIHVCVAIAAGDELFAPVVRAADKKGVTEIDAEIRWLAAKTRSGELEAKDITGGTFTVTNLGMYPVDEFCAIINPPQAGILAVGRISKALHIDETGGMHIRSACTLTGSFDHRIVNGAEGAAFLQKIKEILEEGL
jgi:pyruvate dehydrogenase E2 component (dihydrolipoamide acetyltransferase)